MDGIRKNKIKNNRLSLNDFGGTGPPPSPSNVLGRHSHGNDEKLSLGSIPEVTVTCALGDKSLNDLRCHRKYHCPERFVNASGQVSVIDETQIVTKKHLHSI